MKSVILSSLILVSSLFLYVACVEKPASDSPDSSNSTPPIIPPVAPPATCEDIIVQAECGSTALANNVAANTCMWNGQINPQKCITRAATCAVTNNDNCGIIKPLDNTTCEINAGNCVEKAAAKPDKCEDVEPKEAAACNSAILSDATKKCKWKGGKCVEKVAEKPSTCNLLNEYDCGTKDLKKRPAETCAWNKDTKACVERKKTCKKTSQADCGFIPPMDNTNCKFENNICVEDKKPNSCSEITDLTKCGFTALKNAKANTCAPNNVSKKCVTREANCQKTSKENCGHVTPNDGKACEYNINKCQEKAVINKCADIKNDSKKCNATTLSDGKKCAYHNKNKVCVEKADDCLKTLEANCGHIKPTDNTDCFYYPTGKHKRCMRIPEKCVNILIQDLCINSKTKYGLAFECKWANKKCSPK